MDVSSVRSLSTAPRAVAETSSKTAESTISASNGTQGQVSQEAQASPLPPAQAPSNIGGEEEGNAATQNDSSSANAQSIAAGSDVGGQVDIVA